MVMDECAKDIGIYEQTEVQCFHILSENVCREGGREAECPLAIYLL